MDDKERDGEGEHPDKSYGILRHRHFDSVIYGSAPYRVSMVADRRSARPCSEHWVEFLQWTRSYLNSF